MNPIIGITASLENETMMVHRNNTESIFLAGGIPFALPYTVDMEAIRDIAERIDGLLLTGGGDIDPTLFGEEPLPGLGSITPERDILEIALIRHMLDADKPIFGICRGCQILNIAAGGDMYQDLYTQRDNLLQHTQRAPRNHASHTLQVVENSLLHKVAGEASFKVNSFHHQAIRGLAPGYVLSATAKDGVIEAFESQRHRFVLGVQWHPEYMAETDPISQRLFEAFVAVCGNGIKG
jgi:putative glutamine amidotransferase